MPPTCTKVIPSSANETGPVVARNDLLTSSEVDHGHERTGRVVRPGGRYWYFQYQWKASADTSSLSVCWADH